MCYICFNRNERCSIKGNVNAMTFCYNLLWIMRLKEDIYMPEMVRVNTRISSDLNQWLDEQYERTGIPKSTQVMLALESYRKEKTVMENMDDYKKLVEQLAKLSTK